MGNDWTARHAKKPCDSHKAISNSALSVLPNRISYTLPNR